jgi:hypothetical protein
MSEPVLTPKGQLILAVSFLIGLLAATIVFHSVTMLVLAIMLVLAWPWTGKD